MFVPGSVAGTTCADYYAVRDIDDTAISAVAKEIKELKKQEKELTASGDTAGAASKAEKVKEDQVLILAIRDAQGKIRGVEAGLCQ
eukprot:4997647-Prymnesium_polylepis.2